MLKIRLSRVGKKHIPQYRIVISEHTNPVKSKFFEIVGNHNPHSKQTVIDKEKVLKWLNNGAKPTNTVARLLIAQKIEHKSVVFTPSKPTKSKKAKEDSKTNESTANTDEKQVNSVDESVNSNDKPVQEDSDQEVNKEE